MALSHAFKDAVIALVGEANVDFPTSELLSQPSTSPRGEPAIARIYPKTTDDVAAIVKLAAVHSVALYTVSTGHNWGYGDALPSGQGQVLLDLGRMNKIVEVNETLAYAIIEPGVTQGALYDHLKRNGIKLWLDSTGAGPDGGIIGNVLERGFGHTPYGDRFLSVAGLEIVLASGEILKTGFGRYDKSVVTPVYPYGVGPVLDGLFSQSSLGIVTRMAIWLMPEPEYFCAAIVMAEQDNQIEAIVDRLRPLRLDGTLKSVVHIGNDMRLMSGRMRYPYDRTGGATPLPSDLRETLRRELAIPAWALTAGFYGSHAEVKASVARLKKALAGLKVSIITLDDRKLAMGRRAIGLLPNVGIAAKLRKRIDDGEAAIGLLKGIPSRHFLAGAYWRNRTVSTDPDFGHDPAKDGCGLLWLGPVLPATGDHVRRLMTIIEPIFQRYGFDCLATLSFVNARSLAAVLTVIFDKTSESERASATDCYNALTKAVIDAGYPPYRGHAQYMDNLYQAESVYWQTIRKLKSSLDPDGILAPGRYGA